MAVNFPFTRGISRVRLFSLARQLILTAEADSLPTDEKQWLEDYGLVGCHSSRSKRFVSPRKK